MRTETYVIYREINSNYIQLEMKRIALLEYVGYILVTRLVSTCVSSYISIGLVGCLFPFSLLFALEGMFSFLI